MKIKMLGTGSILTRYLSSSALVDQNLLIDCPNGAMKSMRRLGLSPTDIDVCILTHFHADHCFDIPFLLIEQGLRNIRKKDLIMVGPSGINDRINSLFDLAYPEDWDKIREQSKLQVKEIDGNEKSICFYDYKIMPFRVEHIAYDAYGYIIEKNNKRVGFTGDSILCPNVEKIVELSDLTFADMSFEENSKGHMGMNDIEFLMEKFGHDKIIPTHMTDKVRTVFEKKFFKPPVDGDEFQI